MKVVNSIENIAQTNYRGVALGNFDGVHLGHRELIGNMIADVRAKKGQAVIFSFNPHPKEVLTGKAPYQLTSMENKEAILAGLGVDYFLQFPFTAELSQMDAKEFIEEILIKKLKVNSIFVGFNFRFGKKGQGNGELIKQICKPHGIAVWVCNPVTIDEDVISSSFIRKLLDAGDVNKAGTLLGKNFTVSGNIVRGNQIGRTIGFPTANIKVPQNRQMPNKGVYAGIVKLHGANYKGVINIGVRPTIGADLGQTIEVNIFDFDSDIYGEYVEIIFVENIRGEKKFASIDELANQISQDKDTAFRLLEGIDLDNF